jgi:hypothetical protein
MVVEPALADCNCPRREMRADLLDVPARIESARVVRMDSRSVPDEPAVGGSDIRGCASGAEDIPGAAAGADADDGFGSVLLRARDYIAAVAFERLVGEVRVTVDEPFDIPVFLGHFRSIHRSVGLAM